MMGISKSGTKKRFKLDSVWIALIVVVVIIVGIIATNAIVSYANKSAGQRVFEQYLSAVAKQDVEKIAQTLYPKGGDKYNEFVENYTQGKTEYADFIKDFSPDTNEYKEFMAAPFNPLNPDVRDYGLLLAVEKQIYNNIESFVISSQREADYFEQFEVAIIAKTAFVATDFAQKYRDIISNSSFTRPFTVKFRELDGKWNFLSSFSLLNKLGEVETWYAPFTHNGVEGYELKYLNPADMAETTVTVRPDETSEEQEMTLGLFDTTQGYNGKPIFKVADYAFSDCSELYEIVLADSVISVGAYAFKDCGWLTRLTYENTSISDFDRNVTFGKGAFFNCERLEAFTLPKVNKIVPDYLLYNCPSIKSFEIHDEAVAIGHYAFSACRNLATINIPQSINAIGDNAFAGCESLVDINYYNGKTEAATNEIGENVTRLGANVFSGCIELTTFKLPDSLTKIEEGTFNGATKLAQITLPKNLKSIGQRAFMGTALSVLSMPQSLEVISQSAFANSQLEEVVWATNPKIRVIGASAFENCAKMFKFVLPSSISQIGSKAFADCPKLRVVEVFCSGNISMNADTFVTNSGIPKFYVPNTDNYRSTNWMQLEVYPQSIIQDEVAIMEYDRQTATGTVTERILVQYLGGINDLSINLDDYNITQIGSGAFAYAQYVKNISFTSSNITAIGQNAFTGSNVEFNQVKNRSNDVLYYLEDWLIQATAANPGTKYTANILDLRNTTGVPNLSGFPTGTTASALPKTVGIAGGAFFQTGGIQTIYFPASLVYIGDNAFSYSNNVSSATFENGIQLKAIGNGAFEGCRTIINLDIPASVSSIGNRAFYGCEALRYVVINNETKTLLGTDAFTPSQSILKLYINGYDQPASFYRTDTAWSEYQSLTFDKDIRNGNFAILDNKDGTHTLIQYLGVHPENNPANVNLSTLGVNLTKIAAGAFATANIGSVIIPSTVTDIESYAFYRCKLLSSVTLLAQSGIDSLKYVGDFSFADTRLNNPDSEFVIEATAPNANLVMGANVFDKTVERIVRVGNRTNYVYMVEEKHSAWSDYERAIVADDDPKVFIIMDIDDSDIVHGNNIQTKVDRINKLGELNEYSEVPNSELTFVADADTSMGYEFVGWFAYDLTSGRGEMLELDDHNILVADLENAGDRQYFMAVFRRVKTPISISYYMGDENYGTFSYTSTSEIDEDGMIDLFDESGDPAVITLTAEVKEGYIFTGWFIIDEDGEPVRISDELTLVIDGSQESIEDLELFVWFS